jgi:hypothetical protein
VIDQIYAKDTFRWYNTITTAESRTKNDAPEPKEHVPLKPPKLFQSAPHANNECRWDNLTPNSVAVDKSPSPGVPKAWLDRPTKTTWGKKRNDKKMLDGVTIEPALNNSLMSSATRSIEGAVLVSEDVPKT